MEIVLANSSNTDTLARWTMDEGLAVKPNVTLAPTKRFFRVGTAEVINIHDEHAPKMFINIQPAFGRL
jgi:hypothetical protein